MSFQSVVGRIREDTKQKVLAAWQMYGKGVINREQFLQLSAAIMGHSGAKAAAVADHTVALEVSRLDQTVTSTTGVKARRTPDTYLTALATVLEGEGDILMKLERLALNSPLQSAQDAYDDAVKEKGKGWVRQMDADPCQLCRWWWREGQVWPADHPMPTHPGCECVPRLVNG